MDRIDNIINSVIKESLNREVLSEGVLDDIKNMLKTYKSKKTKSLEDLKKEKLLRKKASQKKNGTKKARKRKGGGKSYYDYEDYERKHKKLSKGDTDSITDKIDQDNTDIAAVADDIFPDHTKTGAQSQLRKILNHERPMAKDVASKLSKMISRGKIAVK